MNKFLIIAILVVGICLVSLVAILKLKGNSATPSGVTQAQANVQPTREITPSTKRADSLKVQRTEIQIRGGICNPVVTSIKPETFVTWTNNESTVVQLTSNSAIFPPRDIQPSVSLGLFFAEKGTYIFNIGGQKCTVEVK